MGGGRGSGEQVRGWWRARDRVLCLSDQTEELEGTPECPGHARGGLCMAAYIPGARQGGPRGTMHVPCTLPPYPCQTGVRWRPLSYSKGGNAAGQAVCSPGVAVLGFCVSHIQGTRAHCVHSRMVFAKLGVHYS